MLEQLLKVPRDIPVIRFYWVLIPLVCMLTAYLWLDVFWTGWVLIPCMFLIASSNLYMESIRRRRGLARIAAIRLDPIFWQRFSQLYPDVGLRGRRLIEQGFKDYLGLQVINRDPCAMPSSAVDALWHVMLEFPLQYQQLCQQTLGRYLNHRPYADNRFYADNSISSQDEQAQQLCHAWRYSCILNGVNPSTTTMLPRLFAIDAALEWPSAQIYELEQLKQQYRQYLKNQSNSSGSSGCSSCSSCGGD